VAEQVVFHGHVSDVSAFIDTMDVIVHASTRPEPLGQTVIQALAAGKPVVATIGGGPSALITSGVNGLLVPPDRPEDLASALRQLASRRQLRELVAAGAAATPGLLSDDESAAVHARFFRSVLNLPGSTSIDSIPVRGARA
jgi:glycosyltransferase involved in cell wall biosynthesis